ncbi:cytochrome P450 [Nocardiopsis lambiniae]|uniref:Cytochrome P450 n=1 Tax=Nocardiopsis lambiniae TaxID=3075539 RepID=A0ABU2MH07_9ACTN|nr:cytochrome P450 [Nocardiopsis sp. DSM 44743]MDT0331981.1 cytochrome P450 [Nocardiopsis sp. DSM 44743]
MDTTTPVRLYDPAFNADPQGFYRKMRAAHGPVVPVLMDGDVPAWLVIGYRELHRVLGDSDTFARDPRRWNSWEKVPPDWPLLPVLAPLPNLLSAEGEDHRRRTRAVNEAINGADPHELRTLISRIADRLIDGFCGAGEVDLRSRYSERIPALVLCRMFGLDDATGDAVTSDMNTVFNAGADAVAAHGRIVAVFTGLIAARRADPGPDIVSRMIDHAVGYGDEDLNAELIAILGGGHQTTGEWIGNALRSMLTDDRFGASLFGARSSAREALVEVLWEDSPSQMNAGRFAAHDVELGGNLIRRGDLLLLGYAAANNDLRLRAEAPEAGHGVNHAHLSFSHGEHSCPHAARGLAETMAVTAIEVLLDRLPDIELSVPAEEVRWRPSPWVRGVVALPVTFTPATPQGVL